MSPFSSVNLCKNDTWAYNLSESLCQSIGIAALVQGVPHQLQRLASAVTLPQCWLISIPLRLPFILDKLSSDDVTETARSFFGLTAALLFGISPPVAKLLLPRTSPMLSAGFLYLGAGLGLLLLEMTGRPWLNSGMEEAPVRRADAALLGGVILTGQP